MNLLQFSIRNVCRHKQRSLITIGAMAFAAFIIMFFDAFLEGFIQTMVQNSVGMNLGTIQIHAEGYRDDPDLYKRIKNPDKLIEKLYANGFSATQRIYGFGLAASGSKSSGAWLRGIDLKNEPLVTQINKHISSGSWLDGKDLMGVVIGKKLSKILDVGVGDEVIILSQATDGSMANDLYRVRGILKSVGNGVDRGAFFMTDRAFRELMVLPEGAHEIAIVGKYHEEDLQKITDEVANLASGLEILNWRQLQPFIAKMIDTSEAGTFIMMFIIYTAIGMVILNAMLMNVFERIHELGVMKAIGFSPWRVAGMLFFEAMIQAAAACLLTLIFGLPVVYYFQTHGIDLSSLVSSTTMVGIAMDPIWHCRITFKSIATPTIFLFLLAALAVIYPAAKAALIRPVEAIYYK